MMDVEDHRAAAVFSECMTKMMHDAAGAGRTWLYVWERGALRWLLRYRERRPDRPADTIGGWIDTFLDCNRDAIIGSGRMDFDVRAFRARVKGKTR